MAWLDIAVIAIVVIVALVGMARGLLKSILLLFGTLATLALSIWLAKPFSALLESWFGLTTALGNAMIGPIQPVCEAGGGEALPNFFLNKFAEILMGPEYWTGYTGGSSSVEFITDFANQIGQVIAVIVAVLILFILIKIVLAILNKIFESISKNRAVSGLDRLFGLILGAVKGALFVSIVFIVAYLIIPAFPAFGDWVNNLLAENSISNTIFTWLTEFTDGTLIPWFNSIT